jgi:hypothetical protein
VCNEPYTNITGNLFIDSFILLILGLIFIGFSFPFVYSEYKDVKQEENRIWKIIWALFMTVSLNVGALAFGCILVFASLTGFISLIC